MKGVDSIMHTPVAKSRVKTPTGTIPSKKKAVKEKESILIVDDDKSTLRTLSFIFKGKGYQAETASTGREALERVRERF